MLYEVITLTTVRFVGGGAHRENFAWNVRSVANADRRAYFTTLRALAAHDAHALLPSVSCPCLVVAGEQDLLTPVSAAKRMSDALPDAELVVIPDASHFGVIEHGPLLWGVITSYSIHYTKLYEVERKTAATSL